jgi:hypothetical protein
LAGKAVEGLCAGGEDDFKGDCEDMNGEKKIAEINGLKPNDGEMESKQMIEEMDREKPAE